MRAILKKARQDAGLTQAQVAEHLGIHERYYKALESGERLGGIEYWDKLEDLFNIHQRKLRENEATHPGQGASR
ncbi:helix-turn-helix transcriptional regulator [Emergencia sp. JLR.KK010]|uniref:helix-turn-helix domain-containing protein n=1 Tax=Emergencia sp. JLR.KK010 TaxID=3114296 RepID=UPI0033130478